MAAKTGNDLKTVRDTIESIWIAIVLAFVLRAFVIEAFVIPTGSMAPRLMGEHFDLHCPACGLEFAHGFSRQAGAVPSPTGAFCPSCAYDFRSVGLLPISGGDRVLVLKYLYQLQPPDRWDVVVFRNPQDNRQNYIKRLIGLPGEKVEIIHGDIFVSRGDGPFEIQRKPDRAQEAMWQVVFDNDYQPNRDIAVPAKASPDAPQWVVSQGNWNTDIDYGRIFEFNGGAGELSFSSSRSKFLPRYGYNNPQEETISSNLDICTDLKLAVLFVPQSQDASVGLELTSFDNSFRAQVQADGTVQLISTTAMGTHTQKAQLSPFEAGRSHQLALTHADLQTTLWVNDKPVLRTTAAEYNVDYEGLKKVIVNLPQGQAPKPLVRITGNGGKFELRHVQLMRDVYYTCPTVYVVSPGAYSKIAQSLEIKGRGDPGWGTTGNPITLAGGGAKQSDMDEFFVLGDNSPISLDGRAWTDAAPSLLPGYKLGTVPRYSMIGKAMFVYWPAGYRIGNVPIIPNVGRMRLIR